MSIIDEIGWRVEEKRLFLHSPRARGSTQRRVLLLSEDIRNRLDASYADLDMEDRMGELEADLDVFSTGSQIDPKYFFLLYPASEGVWEIRSVRPDPQIRILGLFALRDVFVATNMAMRSELGGWESRAWKDVKRLARTRWTQLFHTYNPLISTNVQSLVSGAIDGKYFR